MFMSHFDSLLSIHFFSSLLIQIMRKIVMSNNFNLSHVGSSKVALKFVRNLQLLFNYRLIYNFYCCLFYLQVSRVCLANIYMKLQFIHRAYKLLNCSMINVIIIIVLPSVNFLLSQRKGNGCK